ncbi:MAG: tetratricopeptide repeat protein [Polyangiales bacterium]
MVQSASLDARLLRFRTAPSVQEGVALSEELLTAGRAREARDVAEAASEEGANGAALVLVGRSWMAISDLLQAQKALLRAARVSPNEPDPYRWLGEVLLKRGDPERAAKVLSKAQALAPGDATIQRLGERATRLARIAGQSDPQRAPARPAPPARPPRAAAPRQPKRPPRDFYEEDEPTVIAHDMTETLARASVRPATAASKPVFPPPAAVPKPPQPAPPEAFGDGIFDEEDLPTPVIGHPSSYGLGAPSPFSNDEKGVEFSEAGAGPKRASMDAAMDLELPGAPGVVSAAASPSDRLPPPPAMSRPQPPAPASAPPPPPAPLSTPPTPEPMLAPIEADVGGGERSGAAEDVDAVLDALNAHGLFHPPDDAPSVWSTAAEAKVPKTKVGLTIGVVWVIALLLAGGGYYGWTQWVEAQKAEAAALVEEARVESLRGDHAALVDAERHLREARGIDPANSDIAETLVFALVQRALEGGAFDAGFVRPALQRAEDLRQDEDGDGECTRGTDQNADADCLDEGELGESQGDIALVQAANAVIAFAEGDNAAGLEGLTSLAESTDPRILYIVGRLEQRLGKPEAMGHLEAAAEGSEDLVAVHLALAEARADEGRAEDAVARVQAVLARSEDHLRAALWLAYLQADEGEAQPHLARLDELEERLEHGAPTDHVLFHLTRARLQRRAGDAAEAAESAEAASLAGATEPRLLALVARAAQSLGDLRRAQRAATSAVEGAPGMAEYRRLLAEILVERRDGGRALQVLGPMSMEDPDVLVLTAKAALSVGNEETLAAAKVALDAHIEESEDDDVSVALRALQIRLSAALGESRSALRSARRLVRSNPDDIDAGIALAEAALEESEADTAIEVLTRVTTAAPDHPDAFGLLGRAHRMSGDGEAAEAALRRAMEVRPGNQQAKLLLGYVLLDRGKYDEAETLYAEMARGGRPSVAARLGRIEALLGLNRMDDAQTQFDALPERTREGASGRQVSARIALAAGRPDDAVAALRPLAEADDATTDTRAFFADALYAAGESRAAGDMYDQVLETDDYHPEALIGYAQVLIRGEKFRDADSYLDDAEEALERRVRAPSVHARLLMLRGRIALEKNDGADAREALRAATELVGAPIEAFFWLGEALAGHNTPDARAAYEHFMESEPSGPLAARARRALERE